MMQANALCVKFIELLVQHSPEYTHQTTDLGLWPTPIFRRESVYGEDLYPEFNAGINHPAKVFDTSPMSCLPRQTSLFCPTAVPIHDDSHMNRHM
jgi:hypothetical protein